MTRRRRTGEHFIALSFWALTAVGVVGLVVLVAVSGWSQIRQSWAENEPWFSGFQAASLAIPIAALIAAGVAITTARWGLRAERDRRDIERRDTTERALRDRFHDLVKLLAADELRAREGAAYAVAALADDWHAHYRNEPHRARAEQQVCIDVLISQLRDPMPADDAAYDHMAAFKHSIQGIFRSRLGTIKDGTIQPGAWTSYEFNFDGCTFHDLELVERVFTGPLVTFKHAQFIGDTWLVAARFTGDAWFDYAEFTGDALFAGAHFNGETDFGGVHFTGDALFAGAHFNGDTDFGGVHFTGDALFAGAHFNGDTDFGGAHFTGDAMFAGARFTGDADFERAHFTGPAGFERARFSWARFGSAHFTGDADFERAHLPGDAGFSDAHFASTWVSLENAHFAGGPVWLGDTYFGVPPQEFPKCEVCNELRARQKSAREPDHGPS